ncbi:F-box/kelch-repeat protein At1g80440-like [Salvia miltiorrhiza]|uniref:F-box/kelch-repeat protein At1g80440-like n=1 Tax=Salvia miltiorrhiza TaxID=226208 RepID=UPI0025AD8A70|nr:F-box/kelch-repeat protein At1g80440-like [Salvia miltiorrhiza]
MDSDLIPALPADLGLDCLIRVPHNDLSSVVSVCRSWNREIRLPEFWRRRKLSGLTRRVVVMAQARFDPTQEFGARKFAAVPAYRLTLCEPETGFWAELPPIPGCPDGLPMYCQLVGVGLNLVVMGGWDPETWRASAAVYIYDFVGATWRRGADMPGGERLFFACASDGAGMVFVAGGHDSEKCALRSSLAYDVAGDAWQAMPDMAGERDEAKGVCHGGAFHVIGGYPTNMQGRFEASAESFDVATWRWGPVKEGFLESATCPRNYVDGGEGRLLTCRDADVVACEGSTWRVVAELPCHVRNTAYVTAWPGKVVVIGSERFGEPYNAFVLDLKSCKWERVEAEEEFKGHVQSGCCVEL